MYSWWESYGAGYELRLVTLRDDGGLLVGLIPLMLERRWGFGRLLFVGTRSTDYQDILVREGWEDQVSEAARAALRQLGGWHVADFQQLRPDSVGWSIFRGWRGPQSWVRHEGSPVVEAKPWEELVAALNKEQRKTIRRTLNRLEVDEVRTELARPEDAERTAERLVALHRELWRDRNMTREHATPRWESFIKSTVSRMMARGLGEVYEFRRGDAVVMALFWIVGRDFVGIYHSGVSQEVLRRYQWNVLRVKAGVDLAHTRGVGHVDMLRGEYKHKLQWASKVIPSWRIILGCNTRAWWFYAGYVTLRRRLEQYVFSERCPPYVRRAARGLKKILSSVT